MARKPLLSKTPGELVGVMMVTFILQTIMETRNMVLAVCSTGHPMPLFNEKAILFVLTAIQTI